MIDHADHNDTVTLDGLVYKILPNGSTWDYSEMYIITIINFDRESNIYDVLYTNYVMEPSDTKVGKLGISISVLCKPLEKDVEL